MALQVVQEQVGDDDQDGDAEEPGDGDGLWDLLEPGRVTIFFLGGPLMSQKDVLPILSGLLNAMLMKSKRHGELQRVVVVDDSIVRGTTSRKIVKMLKDAGAREVHLRIASPPTNWPRR